MCRSVQFICLYYKLKVLNNCIFSGLSVADIEKETGVSHDQLQAMCTIHHLRDIAHFVDNYLKFTARFSLPPGVLAGIKTDLNLDFVQKTEQVFLWWHANIRSPTYLSFVETCLDLGEGDVARKMCRLLVDAASSRYV